MHDVRNLGHADAQRAMAAIEAELARRGKRAVIAVADAQGEVVALLRMDGAPAGCVAIASNKAWTAARERKASWEIGKASRDPKTGFDLRNYSDPRYIGWGGALPVVVDGATVGAVAVSGLTEAEDEELAKVGVEAIVRSA